MILQLESSLSRKSHFYEITSTLFVFGSLETIANEVAYTLQSAIAKDDGDFGNIAKKGKIHLLMASSVMIAELALCILVFSKYKKDIAPSIKLIAGLHLLLNAKGIVTVVKKRLI